MHLPHFAHQCDGTSGALSTIVRPIARPRSALDPESEPRMSDSTERCSGPPAVAGLLALAALLFLGVCQSNFVDPDVWHEMALIRQARAEGALPTRDVLAYTPTLEPSIHHEWGTGAILFVAGTVLGATGLLLLK